MGRAGFFVLVEVVHDGEIVHLGVKLVDGEGVGDMHGGIGTGEYVGGDEAAK